MKNTDLLPIREQLDRIEKKLEGKYSDPFLNIKQVADYTVLSTSTIRRAIRKGYLKNNTLINYFNAMFQKSTSSKVALLKILFA